MDEEEKRTGVWQGLFFFPWPFDVAGLTNQVVTTATCPPDCTGIGWESYGYGLRAWRLGAAARKQQDSVL
jgi:hypothetical protein